MRLVSFERIEFLTNCGCGTSYSVRGYDCIDIDTGVHYLFVSDRPPVPRYDAQGKIMVASHEELKCAIDAFRRYKGQNSDKTPHTYTKL